MSRELYKSWNNYKKNYQDMPKILYNLLKKIGPKGTIIVPSHSFNLISRNEIFDVKKTQSSRAHSQILY